MKVIIKLDTAKLLYKNSTKYYKCIGDFAQLKEIDKKYIKIHDIIYIFVCL